jgi:hypothetical protein
MGCRDREKERKRLRDTERQIKYTESRQNGTKKEREGEEEAEGNRETDKIYRKQTEWGVEGERRRGRG